MVAGKAMGLAYLFNSAFNQGLPGPVWCKVEMMTPAGMSTAGGKQSLQHVRLVPQDGSPALVMASVKSLERMVEIRTFKHLGELWSRRFKGAPIPVDAEQYRQLVARIQSFFSVQGFNVVMVDVSTSLPPPSNAPAASQGSTAAIVLAVLVFVLLIAVGVVLVLRLKHVF